MKIAIFGGSGRTGQHIVEQALQAGHKVQALVRTPSKVQIKHDNLMLIQGDILDGDAVARTITGTDAVMSVLGPISNKPDFTISKGTDLMLNAMRQNDVDRIIISAGAGVRDPQDKPKFIDKLASFVLNLVSKNVVADMKQVVDKVRQSGMTWTVVRVPMLTDEPAKGTFKVGYVGDISPRLSRADMAHFMLEQLQSDTWHKAAPAISN
jgi:putative NADH-flavin reductase